MDLRALYPARRVDGRKGDFGHVLVAGGSERYSGAPAFNALAALRAGADLVTVVAPRRAADIVAGFAPDLMTVPCDAPFPEPRAVLELAERVDVLVIGGGIARSAPAHQAMRQIIEAWPKPMVLDAEALQVVKKPLARAAVLTPHGGEFAVLTGDAWPEDEAARRAACAAAASRFGATVAVKGARDVVSDGARVHVDEAGSPFMTKGGHGDVFAGIVGALLARGVVPFEAACGAAFIIGRAGERAGARLGEGSLASDVLAEIAAVISSG